jgi:hypothetical protein
MAGDWIKMRTDLATSPKVVRIASALRADRFRIVGALHAVWCLFDTHSEDGRLEGYSLATIDDLIGFPGFAIAMNDVGWLVETDEGVELPRFDDHNGLSAKRRAMESDRKRKARLSALDADSDADELRTREEKRREEEKQETTAAEAPASKTVRGTRIAKDWKLTEELLQMGRATRPEFSDSDIRRAADSFYDHWTSTTKGATKLDWLATWRNWMRNQRPPERQKRSGPDMLDTSWANDLNAGCL